MDLLESPRPVAGVVAVGDQSVGPDVAIRGTSFNALIFESVFASVIAVRRPVGQSSSQQFVYLLDSANVIVGFSSG